MRLLKGSALAAASFLAAVSLAPPQPAVAAQAPGGRPPAPPPVFAWAPKPTRLAPYVAPQKPHTKLADVLAKHRGQRAWREPVVDDRHMVATWVQMAPGEATKTMYMNDHRYAAIVWDGQVRVTIGGQEPFIATKGFMIQVPFRNAFKLEVVGDKPGLFFEIMPQDSVILYADSETTPSAPAGTTWYRARLQGQDTYAREQIPNQPQRSIPYLDFFKAVATPPGPRGAFVQDDRSFVNIIRGPGIPRQPDTVKGHFHLKYGEFWFIMEGQVSYLIEGLPYFVAEPGDVVYAASGRWHRAAFAGNGMATRIAINGYPNGSHLWDPNEGD